MPHDFRRFEMPGTFARRYNPVRVHPDEQGLAAFVLDEYGLRFFRIMVTGCPVPAQAIWSIVRRAADCAALHLVAGRHDDSRGYVVCDVPYTSGDVAAYLVPRRLTFRAKVTIAALQALLHDLPGDAAASADRNVIDFIERRIDQLRT
jgi:hypothetical protein